LQLRKDFQSLQIGSVDMVKYSGGLMRRTSLMVIVHFPEGSLIYDISDCILALVFALSSIHVYVEDHVAFFYTFEDWTDHHLEVS
jgi:hypothetical protein